MNEVLTRILWRIHKRKFSNSYSNSECIRKVVSGSYDILNFITSYNYETSRDSNNKIKYKLKTEKLSDDLVRVSMNVSPIQNLNYNENSETGAKEYISEYTDGEPIKNCMTHFVVNTKTGKVENIVLTN